MAQCRCTSRWLGTSAVKCRDTYRKNNSCCFIYRRVIKDSVPLDQSNSRKLDGWNYQLVNSFNMQECLMSWIVSSQTFNLILEFPSSFAERSFTCPQIAYLLSWQLQCSVSPNITICCISAYIEPPVKFASWFDGRPSQPYFLGNCFYGTGGKLASGVAEGVMKLHIVICIYYAFPRSKFANYFLHRGSPSITNSQILTQNTTFHFFPPILKLEIL